MELTVCEGPAPYRPYGNASEAISSYRDMRRMRLRPLEPFPHVCVSSGQTGAMPAWRGSLMATQRSKFVKSSFRLNFHSPHGMFIALPLSAALWAAALLASGVIH